MLDPRFKFLRQVPPAWQDSRGITGLETAIVLTAFAALSTGLFSSDKAKETINACLAEARGTLELRGSIIAKSSGDAINEISFHVSNAAGGQAVELTPGETLITYTDVNQSVTLDSTATTGGFTVTPLGNADSDDLVEPGEMYEVKIIGLDTKLNPTLLKDRSFTLEVKPPQGAVIHIERRTPVVLDTFNDLG